MATAVAYIGIGSNLGLRDQFLLSALRKMEEHEEISVVLCSSIYETDPYGPVEQNNFLNMVAKVTTSLEASLLLKELQRIEMSLERKREVHWGPRTIDLDILLYNDENIKMEHLKVPHPELSKRLFVLTPLMEIEPELILPDTNESVATLHRILEYEEGVCLWKRNNGGGEFGLFEN